MSSKITLSSLGIPSNFRLTKKTRQEIASYVLNKKYGEKEEALLTEETELMCIALEYVYPAEARLLQLKAHKIHTNAINVQKTKNRAHKWSGQLAVHTPGLRVILAPRFSCVRIKPLRWNSFVDVPWEDTWVPSSYSVYSETVKSDHLPAELTERIEKFHHESVEFAQNLAQEKHIINKALVQITSAITLIEMIPGMKEIIIDLYGSEKNKKKKKAKSATKKPCSDVMVADDAKKVAEMLEI